jgi:transposase
MAKYDEQFRRQLVAEYLEGAHGYQALGARYGLHGAMIQRWVASYRAHGDTGLAKKYGHYDARFKLRVLDQMRRDHLSYRQAAALFGIRNERNIPVWERLYDEGGLDALKPRRRGRPPKMPPAHPEPAAPQPTTPEERSREDLLKEIEYLRAEVAYLKKLDASIREEQHQKPRAKRK